jgi:hypothetical protein
MTWSELPRPAGAQILLLSVDLRTFGRGAGWEGRSAWIPSFLPDVPRLGIPVNDLASVPLVAKASHGPRIAPHPREAIGLHERERGSRLPTEVGALGVGVSVGDALHWGRTAHRGVLFYPRSPCSYTPAGPTGQLAAPTGQRLYRANPPEMSRVSCPGGFRCTIEAKEMRFSESDT